MYMLERIIMQDTFSLNFFFLYIMLVNRFLFSKLNNYVKKQVYIEFKDVHYIWCSILVRFCCNLRGLKSGNVFWEIQLCQPCINSKELQCLFREKKTGFIPFNSLRRQPNLKEIKFCVVWGKVWSHYSLRNMY